MMEAENNMEENQQQQQQEQQQNPQTVESQLQEQEILQPSETTGQMTPMESIGEAVGDALPIETHNPMNAEPLLPREKFQETRTEVEPMDSIVAPLEATKEEETHEPSIQMTDDVPLVPENVAPQIVEVPVPSEPEPQAFQNHEDTSPTVSHNENPFDDVDSSNLNSYLKRTMQNEVEEEEASPKKPKFNEDSMTASEQSSENPQDSLIPNSEAVESSQLLIASVEPHQPAKVENLDPMPQIENSQTDFSAIPAEESLHSSENGTDKLNSPLNEVAFHQSQPSPPALSRVPSMVVEKMIEKKPIEEPTPTTSVMYKEAMDIHEKLREMGEISVKPVLKGDHSGSSKKTDGENEISVEIKKKSGDKYESEDSKRITNLRKNIREVMDENQLDATTLAAQRQESERLARVQEQQKIIRELQRQMAAERQNNRTQSRVMSILQGQTSLLKNSNSERLSISGNASTDMYIVKGVASEVTFKGSGFVDVDKISSGNLTPSVSIAPVRRSTVKDVEEPPEEDSDTEKKEVVTIVDSSSENDCIVLSDDDEIEEEPEDDPHNSGLHVNDAYNIPDEEGRVVINIGHPEGESDIFVAPQIARVMKPHQIGGVRFLYDNIIESTERFSTSTGFGCILAHSMGLGKTLQIVCFCDIFLRHTNSKSILCIMPINTLQNWVSEFNMWLPEDPDRCPLKAHGEIRTRNFKIFVLNDQYKTVNARARVILEWARNGGVLLIGYELFRLLSLKMTNKKKRGKKFVDKEVKVETDAQKRQMEDIHAALVKPGPDLVICDEGHRIKNSHASISVALKQIRSKRRIVLTGYPLQNNLLEYWCMVDFVRPNYLGTKTEFANMFERPIQNGQCIDSTPQDIKLMRYRAHVLHSLLVGFVQRRSHVVLQNSLPQKEEYVILVKMTAFQRKLYEVFMNEVVRTKAVPNPLKAFAVCCKIWNHPDVLYQFLKKREADLDLEIEEVEGDSSSTSTSTSTASSVKGKGKKPAATKKTKEINKDGKTIPSVEVPPNQSKGPAGATTAATTTTTNTAATMSPAATATTAASSGSSSSTVTTPAAGNKSPKKEDIKPQVANIISPPEGIPPPSSMQYESGNFLPYNSYGYDGYYNSMYQQPGSMYQQPGYGSQNYNSFSHSNTNSYWQGNSNYYPYGTHQSGGDGYNQDELSYPHIGSIKSEPNDSPLTDKKSSEIVDLDTKEITTVETNIDSIPFCDVKEEIKEEEAPVEIKPETPEEVIPPVEKDVVKVKEDGIPYEWAVEIVKGYVPELLESSPKMVVFFCLLEESLRLGDRILVFSQSLLTLNTIENFLQSQKVPGYDYYWAKNTTYYRLDGSTTAMEREKLINEFNGNPQIHLFLVSTRAGSLGINLVGANRVIVFDASWNPCHDTQAVCRVYRYGQKKPCFVYRLVMDSCLEKKIYDRQVNKQGMSDRVVDECNPDAHLSMKEVTNLCFDNEEEKDTKDFSDCKDKYLDIVMQKVIEKHCDMLSKEPFHHESLLVDRKEKKLSQAEKRLAQRGYEMEKRAAARPAYIYNSMGTQYRVMKTSDGAIVHRPVASVRPMQAEVGEKFLGPRPGGVRPTRWIPAEVWQRQGMTAQEMTLPLDVVIPTSSGDKANIVLKAGQKVMVLKSPKGIYMQLESGKIIAIRTSLKVNQNKEKGEDSESNSLSSALSSEEVVVKPTSRSETDTPQQKVNPTSSFSSVTSLLRKESSSGAGSSHSKQNLELDSPRTQNDSSSHGAVFKSGGRPTATTHGLQQTPSAVSKPFNVQSLISNKTPSYQYKNYSSSNSKSHGNPDVITIPDLENAGQSQSSKQNFSQSSRMYNQRPQINYMSKHQPGHLIMNSPTANVKPSLSTKSHPPTITIEDDFEPPLREKVVYKPNLVDRKQRPSVSKTMPVLNHPFGHKMERNIKPSHMANPSQNNTAQPSERATATTDGNNIGNRQFHNVKPYNRSSNESSKTSLPQATASNSTSPMPSSRPVGHGSTGRVSSKQRMPTIRNIPAPYPSICAAQGQSSASATSSSSTTVPPSTYVQQQQQQKQQKSAQNQPETETTPPATNNYASSQYSASQPEKHAQPSNEYTSDSHSLPSKRKVIEPKDDHQLPVSVAGPTATAAATTPTMSTPATSLPVPEASPRQEPTQPIKEEPTKESFSTPQSYFNPHSTPYGLPSTDPSYSYASEHGAYHHQPQSSYGSTFGSMNPPLSSHGYSYPPAAPPHPGPSQSSYPYDSYHGHYDSHLYASSQPSSATSNYHSTTLPAASNTTQPPNQYHYPGYPPPPPPPSVSDQYNSYYGYPPYPQTGQWQQ